MFQGFTKDALGFLSDIRFNNNQTYYENNRQRYEEYVKAPLRALCDEMKPVVELIDSRLDTRPGRTMSRIRRDTRFTKDKSPFRDHVWLGWRYPGESRSEGFGMYWGFGPDWLSWGCGCYSADKPLMDALRLTIRGNPDEVREAFAVARIREAFEVYGESYRKLKVPDDVPEDLRFLYVKKGFGIEHNADEREWKALESHEMADILARDLAAMAPLQQLMQRMRQKAEYAQAQAVREREAQQRAAAIEGQQAQTPARRIVRSAEEFEF
ncbi:MAG: DUF2461 domain-containing protein [Clostridia bacterium]|nr:DUF2461 domain-containing protein [Clostridia bacterium]